MKSFLCLLLLYACAAKPTAPPLAVGPEARAAHVIRDPRYALATLGVAAHAAGEEIFAAGGNSIDAAVAVSFAISVERPQSTGIGGGGFLLYREAKTGNVYAVDFRERAPLKASRDMYLDEHGQAVPTRSLNGSLAVATPGLVAGLLEIHEKWGTLPLARVMAPAIAIADKGFPVTPALAAALARRRDVLAQDPAAQRIFLKPDGSPYRAGEMLVQKDLAATLRRVARNGRAGFYGGFVGAQILGTMKRLHGLLEQKDFDAYRVKWPTPLHGTFRGFDIFTMPPPSSGGIHVLQILNTLEQDPLRELGALSPLAIHRTASAMQFAYADRAVYPGDPDFVRVPTDWLVSKNYARERRALIHDDRALPASAVLAGKEPAAESPETTHFSILDRQGNAVSSTQTINYSFGSGLVAEGTGVVLNDEMDDFSAKAGAANVYGAVGGDANAVAPGKTPLSSMSPTIVVKEGQAVIAVGAPGGTRIINCVAETLLNQLAYGLPPYESVALVRFHEQWLPDQLFLEPPGPGKTAVEKLKALGWKLNEEPGQIFCRVALAVREGDTFTSVSDPRD